MTVLLRALLLLPLAVPLAACDTTTVFGDPSTTSSTSTGGAVGGSSSGSGVGGAGSATASSSSVGGGGAGGAIASSASVGGGGAGGAIASSASVGGGGVGGAGDAMASSASVSGVGGTGGVMASSASVSGVGGAGGAMASSASVSGVGGAGGVMASSASVSGVGGAGGGTGGVMASSASVGGGGAGGSAASSSSASSSSGAGGSTCGLIGPGDLLWSHVIPYPHATGVNSTTPCWPTAVSVRTSDTGGALMRLDFVKDPACWVSSPSPDSPFPGPLVDLLARFDNAGQLASAFSIIDYNSYPILSHMLQGGADVDGSGGILRGETFSGVHPGYRVSLSNGPQLAFSFGFSAGQLDDPKLNTYVSIGAVAAGPSGDAAAYVSSFNADYGGGPWGGSGLLRLGPGYVYQWMAFLPGVYNMKIDDAGNTLVAGGASSSVFSSPCGALSPGASLLKLDIDGSCVYQRPMPGELVVTADGAGDAIVAMKFSGTIDLGGGPLTAVGVNDMAVAKYDASGAHLWSERFGGPGFDPGVWAVTANAAGEVALQGSFAGAVDFGAGPVDAASPCAPDAFITKLAPTGAVAWAKYLHAPGAFSSAIDPQGAVLLVGASSSFDLGSGPALSSPGMAVAKLAP